MSARAAVIVLALVGASLACSEGDVECRWGEFKRDFSREYRTAGEERERRGVFEENLREMARMSAEMPDTQFGVTKFSDLRRSEFKEFLRRSLNGAGRVTTTKRDARDVVPTDARDDDDQNERRALPTTWTWPYLTNVHEYQGECGSCWAYASLGVVESLMQKVAKGVPELSVQQLVDCDLDGMDWGCSGGWPDQGLLYIANQTKYGGGVMPASDYRYEALQGLCRYNKKKAVGKITSTFTVNWNEKTMDSVLWKRGPLAVVFSAYTLQFYKGGVLISDDQCGEDLDHAALLVGWGQEKNGKKWWKIKNSWGPTWGEKGYFRIERGTDACLLTLTAAAGATVSSKLPACVATRTCAKVGRKCGMMDDGCGRLLSCGKCSSTQTCTDSGICASNGQNVADWIQFLPVKATGAFTVTKKDAKSPVVIAAKNEAATVTAEKGIMWIPSSSWTSSTMSGFSANVTATTGYVGLGMRLGQPASTTDAVWMRWVIQKDAEKATMVLCQQQKCKLDCKEVAKDIYWNKTGPNAVQLVMTYDPWQKILSLAPLIDGFLVGDLTYQESITKFPRVGRSFLTYSGGTGTTFKGMHMYGRTRIMASLGKRLAPKEWRAAVASALRVSPTAVLSVKGSCSPKANCNDGKFDTFDFVLADSGEALVIGAGAHSVPLSTSSGALAEQLQAIAASGSLGGIEVASMTLAPIALGVSGSAVVALGTLFGTATAAGLSTLALTGIIVGSAAACALVVGGVATGVVVARRRRSRTPDSLKEPILLTETAPSPQPPSGVDILCQSRYHSSITGRQHISIPPTTVTKKK